MYRKIVIACCFALFLAVLLLPSACCRRQPVVAEPAAADSAAAGARFVVLDPGHFHAALIFKRSGYEGVSPQVGVYAPVGEDYVDHMARVIPFNTRQQDPAAWRYDSYLGPDYQERMLEREQPGSAVVLSGRNDLKIDRILASVQHGFHVIADKPWLIEAAKLPLLEQAIAAAQADSLVIMDIMTERFEVTTQIQREIVGDRALFGEPAPGTPEDPAVVKQSVHHLSKQVAGVQLKRPWWFFDTTVQGEGLVDVTTHLVDIIFWTLFPEQPIDCGQELELVSAERWPTVLSREQYARVTQTADFNPQLALNAAGGLDYFSNGKFVFKVRGVSALVQVVWNFEAPAGGGDTHYSLIRGTLAEALIQQGAEQSYRPELYVRPAPGADRAALGSALQSLVERLAADRFPGISLVEEGRQWRIEIPAELREGHEAHFGRVADRFLAGVNGEPAPDWEYRNLYAKYFVTTSALELARRQGVAASGK